MYQSSIVATALVSNMIIVIFLSVQVILMKYLEWYQV